MVDLTLLPQKVLFLHGYVVKKSAISLLMGYSGLDKYIKRTQSETMKEILRGVGIQGELRLKQHGLY